MIYLKKRISLFILLTLLLSGCATVPYEPEFTRPGGVYHIVGSGQNLYRISKAYGVSISDIMRVNNIQNPDQIGVGEKLFIPKASAPICVIPHKPEVYESVAKLVGKKQYRVKWRTITLHHSATLQGNAEAFDRNHRRRRMGGLAYHFVIGNGTDSGNGEIEVGWRWKRQIEASRKKDIQICLVGNFNKQEVSQAQFDSLVKLLNVLIEQYSIPLSSVRRNKDVPGVITECPGKNFPFYKILAELKKS